MRDSILEQIKRDFFGYAYDYAQSIQVNQRNIDMLNDAAAGIVRGYHDIGLIAIGPMENDITICTNIPLDALVFCPLAGIGVNWFGTYNIYRNHAYIGRITYKGRPEQDGSAIAILGAAADFMPKVTVEELSFTIATEWEDHDG